MLAYFSTRSVRFKAAVAGDSCNKVKQKLPILFVHIHIHTCIHRVDVVNIVFAIYKELSMDVFVSNKNVNTKQKKVWAHRIYFLAFNALCPILREMYFISSGFHMTDNKTLLAISPADLIT